jgi:hypothetical protein
MMRVINALWMSFYSPTLYRAVFTQWRGIGFLYLGLLALIQTIVSTAQLDAQLDLTMRDYAPAIVQQIPTITIHESQASTPEARPYLVRELQSGRPLALIDTSLDQPPDNLRDTPVFIGKNHLLIFNNPSKPQEMPFSLFQNTVVDRAMIVSWLKYLSDWGALLFSPAMLLIQLSLLLFQVLFFSLFAWIHFRAASIKASYASILRLTAVSLSPALLSSIVLSIFFEVTDMISFIYVVLAIVYLSYATHAAKHAETISPEN